MKTLRLFHPEYAGLQFGANNEIQFGARAGLPDHVAEVPEDHPLLPALLAAEPTITVLTDAGPTEVFPCPFGCGAEDFKTRRGVIEHLTNVHMAAGATETGDEDDPAPTRQSAPKRAPARRRSRSRAKPKAKPSPVAVTDTSPASSGDAPPTE